MLIICIKYKWLDVELVKHFKTIQTFNEWAQTLIENEIPFTVEYV